jgi:glycerol kinase
MTLEAPFLLAVDQGATSTRAILFDAGGKSLASHSIGPRQVYPEGGLVGRDGEEIWQSALACCRIVSRGIAALGVGSSFRAFPCGILTRCLA